MCQTNFCLWYTPLEYISLDESTMAFLQFNPSKPNKFHIKLFMVSEHLSGYISLDESTMAFLQFNPSKPNKFHIKLFMVSEHLSGYISLDESTMAFLQFNPSKPNKFHIKLFMVSEHLSGYISGFSVYIGKTANKLVAEKATLDPYCSVTTKTVMSLLLQIKITWKSLYSIFWQLLQFLWIVRRNVVQGHIRCR